MAITKIHPIKTTLNLSIDYICDTSKTDEQILISSYKCGYQTAAFQFTNTKELMNSSAKNLARHLIQSFMPGEITAETAHQIGTQLCDKHLKEKYEYVLTTHVDKGHIHNHIIFNNVSLVDGKSYISNKKSYHEIRNISDQICKNNNLSIATETNKSKSQNKINGISYKEYQERKNGNSYKAKLQFAIDAAIKRANNWKDFLKILQENGYEIKYGKHISFKIIGQERFTRSKTIGADYTEERIKDRINERISRNKIYRNKQFTNPSLNNKVVDIYTNDLAAKSIGFARWLKLQNLKNMSKSWNDISANNITDLDSFYNRVAVVYDELGKIQNQIKQIESEIQDVSDKIRNITTYKNYKSIYGKYQKTGDKDTFFRMHENKIILFEAAREKLDKPISNKFISSIPELKEYLSTLEHKTKYLMNTFANQKKEVSKINLLKTNLETYLKSNSELLDHQH